MFLTVAGGALAFAVSVILYLHSRLQGLDVGWVPLGLIFFKAGVEIWCSIYAGYFVFISLHYLLFGRRAPSTGMFDPCGDTPSLAIVYLCCDDFEPGSLDSLCRTRANGPFRILIHDDSADEKERERVDLGAQKARERHGVSVEVLRRRTREGGKPGALNYILERIPQDVEWMLICDNDSVAPDLEWYARAAPMLSERKLACVQFRNVGPGHARGIMRHLDSSIDVFEVFVSPAERFGWLPFFGHNALLRVEAVREIGGFTPGEFADDIDLSIRLMLAGYRIRYRPDVAFRESHPDNYAAFRMRSYKWAYGCTSVLRRWGLPLLRSTVLPARRKFFFLVFIGFYYTQIALLAYLLVSYVILPFLIPEYDFSPLASVLGGSLVLLLMYLPTLAYSIGNGKLRDWPGLAATVGTVYGSIDFVSARAVIDSAFRRPRTWVPTNTVRSRDAVPAGAWIESATGFLLLAVPFIMLPHLLYLPCSYVFAMKFMVVPLLYVIYRGRRESST